MRRLIVVAGNATVNCSEVQCKGACDSGSARGNLVWCSAEVLNKLLVKAMRWQIIAEGSAEVNCS